MCSVFCIVPVNIYLLIFFFFYYLFIDSSKSSEDVVKEGEILREILQIVEQRDALIAVLEEDRQRCGLPRKRGRFRQILSVPPVVQLFQIVSSTNAVCLIFLLILVVMWTVFCTVVGLFSALSLPGDTL
jgi:hypothetical protein